MNVKLRFMSYRVVLFVLILCTTLAVLYVYLYKTYYPPFPDAAMSKKEVLDALESTAGELMYLTEDEDKYWYGYKGNQGDGRDELISFMNSRGWIYQMQEGSSYFFIRDISEGTIGGVTTIVDSEMWTSQYVLYSLSVSDIG